MSAWAGKATEMIGPALEKIDSLSRRERLLVMVTGFALIVAVWHTVLIQPLAARADASRAELVALRERIETTNRTLEEQVLQLSDAGRQDRSRIASMQARVEEINAALGDFASELIDPAEMARVLEEILKEQSELTLLRIANGEPESVPASDAEDATRFYRHVLEIEVEGSYRACLEYLTEIESLPWRLYWQLLDLEVIEYPRNRIRIEVSTLSLDEEWIGA